jgi:membrane protease YdiL (CAAX protease family)
MLFLYYGLLMLGLATMLLDGWGPVALITYVVWMPIGALLLWRASGRSWADLRASIIPGYPHWRRALGGAVIAAGTVCLIFSSIVVAGWLHITAVKFSLWGMIVGVMMPQVLVATFEEVTFRGIIQRLLAGQYGIIYGLTGASLLFGLFHLPNIIYHDVPTRLLPITLITLIVMGWVFGWAFFVANQHLALPIGLHWGWNVACFGLDALFTPTLSGPSWLVGVWAWFPESGIVGLAGLILVGWAIRRVAYT